MLRASEGKEKSGQPIVIMNVNIVATAMLEPMKPPTTVHAVAAPCEDLGHRRLESSSICHVP